MPILDSELNELLNPKYIGPDYISRVVAAANRAYADAGWGDVAGNLTRRRLPVELVYISDNGHTGTAGQPVADQAADEIKGRLNTIERAFELLLGAHPNIKVRYQNVASQDTLGGAAALKQAVIGEVPVFGRVVFLNVAPRKTQRGVEADNAGEQVFLARHDETGTIFGGTGPDCFTFFRNEIARSTVVPFTANVAIKGSQFRSRDFFPWLSYVAALGVQNRLQPEAWRYIDHAKPLALQDVPDVPNNGAVATSIDVHGNIKTALTGARLALHYPHGGEVYIRLNGCLLKAHVANGSFEKKEGTLVLSRGSTYRDPLNLENSDPAAIEIFKVGARAADDFGLTAANLRGHACFDVFDAALLDAKAGAPNDTRPMEYLQTAARDLVAAGLVKGLDDSKWRESLTQPVRSETRAASPQNEARP